MKKTYAPNISITDTSISLFLPIITVSEANGGARKTLKYAGKTRYRAESWRERAKRHKQQKIIVFSSLKPYADMVKLPCTIKLTRFAPRKLDKFDNLPMSMKYILDAVCAVITGDYRPGRADDTEEIEVIYDQVQTERYAVSIQIMM
jgi:hypothetical protein